MHTLNRNRHHNKRLIEFCLHKAYPDGIITVDKLIDDNLVNGTQVAELAISRTAGIPLDLIGIGMDLEDGTDVKTTTVQENKKKTWIVKDNQKTGKYNISISHAAPVKDIINKIGALRVIIYNPFTEKNHFLIIPKEVHQKVRLVKVTFCKTSGNIKGMYSKYEVPTWELLCQPCKFVIQPCA